MAQFVATERCWQVTDDEHAVTFVDKLIGLEMSIQTFDGETPKVCAVIPPVMVGNLINTLIRFVTTGSLAIARQENA